MQNDLMTIHSFTSYFGSSYCISGTVALSIRDTALNKIKSLLSWGLYSCKEDKRQIGKINGDMSML
jgi:hypothetical protein